jgi:thiol:disulfide interchange protein
MVNPMRTFLHRWMTVLALMVVGASSAAARAGTSADVSAEAETSALPAGSTTRIAVVIDVHDGLHAQSHTPGNDDYIPTKVTVKPPAGLTAEAVVYPTGKDVNFPKLGATLNVYVGQVIAYVPVTVAAGAKPGPVQISGTVHLQACNESSCFQPETIKFTVETSVVAAGTAVTKNHPELFPAAPAAAVTTKPTTAPAAAAPPAKAAAGGSGDANWFARHLKSGGLPVGLAGAFVIGILFNAVPCVLPVIPLKVLGFYEVSKHDRGRCLFLGATFGAGIVAVFAVLGVLIAGLHVIDWGKLFQQTWFIAAITAVLLAVAAGTFGLFDVALPTGVYGFSPRHDNVSGNFLFGMLTAVLSTPCTFGLLTALLTWTLTLPAVEGSVVFVTIGLGMASPYVLLSAFPELARRFPKTGPWSEVVKQEMGLLMLAAAAFFAQPLLAHLMPFAATWWVLFAAIALAAGFLVVRAAELAGTRWPTVVAGGLSLVMICVALLVTLRLTRWPYTWQPYSPQALAAATASGHPVVIDFTATWCSTCHYLEANALHDGRVVDAVRDHRAVMLRADVTYGTEIGQPLLERLNPTHTIPFTAVYPPHAAIDGRPAVLDGIYTAADLVGVIDRTSGS